MPKEEVIIQQEKQKRKTSNKENAITEAVQEDSFSEKKQKAKKERKKKKSTAAKIIKLPDKMLDQVDIEEFDEIKDDLKFEKFSEDKNTKYHPNSKNKPEYGITHTTLLNYVSLFYGCFAFLSSFSKIT